VMFCVEERIPGRIADSAEAKDRLERETGFEPATSTLARLHSTS
jgi:hypothetical protein